MKKFLLMLIAALMFFSFAQSKEHYFRFNERNKTEVNKITRMISIDNVKDGWVYAYANDKQLKNFQSLGYAIEHLPHPGSLISPKMSDNFMKVKEWDSYPTFEAYVSMMQQFAIDFPDLCVLDTIGFSVENRPLLVVKISDNVNIEETEAEFFYTSTMHGDETTGYILMLRLIDFLLTNYGESTDDGVRATNLVNNLEIWINPLANPDGTYASGNSTVNGATRYNANYVDLNRNYPDPEDGQHPDGEVWQSETVAMMAFAEAHNLIISSNMHGGAEVVNYPWDTWVRRHADDDWWQDVCHTYADAVHAHSTGYMTGYDDGITNGYDWYEIAGGRQDYMNYFRHCREMTLELSDTKLLPADQLPAHWDYNKEAFLLYIEECFQGISGIVTNEEGEPLAATITVVDHDVDNSHVITDPDLGDYYRLIMPGTYNIYVEAGEDYVGQTISNVTVENNTITTVDVVMQHMATQSISGTVSLADELSPEGAKLKINNDSTYADALGHFEFAEINIGEVSIDVTNTGYLPIHLDTVLTVGNPMNLEFNLNPLPELTLTPDSIGVTVDLNSIDSTTITIKNESISVLTIYGITDQMTAKENVGEKPAQQYTPRHKKGEKEQTNPPMLKNSGGPDGYGYTWIDSDEPGGPSYDWVEISGIGTASGVTSDDAEGGPFTLGFDFDYYGSSYSQIYIQSNGFISFTSNGSGLYSNGGIPNSDSPNNILAPFWDDLSPNNGGTIYYYADAANQRFIVEYDNVPHYSYSGNEGPYTFQVIINANGSIKYQYNNMNTPLEEATIGIENNDGTDGLQVVYNAAYVYDGLAILFSRGASWLAYDSFAGDILPGDSVNVKLTFNSSGLTEGIYNSLLSIENNGVNPVVQKTVTMTVQQLTSVNDGINNLPAKYELQQNYPNPFNPATTIKYNLLEAHNVTLKIYNILGEEVRTLVSNKHQPAKSYRVEWNGKDNTGRMVASGMYIYHIEAGSFIQSKKMILLK